MPRDEVLRRAVEARKARPITAAESRARFALVERLLVVDTPPLAMVRICKERFPTMSESAVERVKARVFKTWGEQDAELSVYRKAQARRRLLRTIARAVRVGDFRAAIAAETLLAKIDGIIATERLHVDVNGVSDPVNAALLKVIGGMRPEDRQGLVDEYDALERRAALAPPLQ